MSEVLQVSLLAEGLGGAGLGVGKQYMGFLSAVCIVWHLYSCMDPVEMMLGGASGMVLQTVEHVTRHLRG